MVDQLPFTPSAADQTDVTFGDTLASSPAYQPKDYLTGRKMLPSWIYQAPHIHVPYSYGDVITINAGSADNLPITIEADAYFLVESVQIVSSLGLTTNSDEGLTLVQFSDSSYNQPWSNIAVPLRDAAGFGANQKQLAYPNLLRPTSTILATLQNNASSAQTYYVTYSGRKIYGMTEPEAVFLARRQFYQYAISVPTITASQLGVKVPLQIFGQSDFLLKKIFSYQLIEGCATANSGAGTDILWQLRDTTNDRYLFNQKVNMRLMVGAQLARVGPVGANAVYSYGQGFWFRKPLYIRRNAILEAEFDNQTANAMPSAFIVTFDGARIYDAIS